MEVVLGAWVGPPTGLGSRIILKAEGVAQWGHSVEQGSRLVSNELSYLHGRSWLIFSRGRSRSPSAGTCPGSSPSGPTGLCTPRSMTCPALTLVRRTQCWR